MLNKITTYTEADVVPAIVEAGLPITSVPGFLAALQTGSEAALEKVPGVNLQVIQAGIAATTEAYAKTFQTGNTRPFFTRDLNWQVD